MFYPFSNVKVVMKNLGFGITVEEEVAFFRHSDTGHNTLMGIDSELGSNYLREKMNEIDLPFDYFHHLAMTVRKLNKNNIK